MKIKHLLTIAAAACIAVGCNSNKPAEPVQEEKAPQLADKYAEYTLTTDISHLSDNEKEMLPLLFEAADIMDGLFWRENYGDKDALMTQLTPEQQRMAMITYGPWDGLNGNKSFVEGIGEKPAGAQFYPVDMTEEEWEAFADPDKNSQYTTGMSSLRWTRCPRR